MSETEYEMVPLNAPVHRSDLPPSLCPVCIAAGVPGTYVNSDQRNAHITGSSRKESAMTTENIETPSVIEAAPIVPPQPAPDLRAFANELLSALDKAEQPIQQRLTDSTFRREVCSRLAKVRGYRDDILSFFTWRDVREEMSDDAADDDDVREAVLDNLDWSDVEDRFSREISRAAQETVAEMDVQEIIDEHSVSDFAEHEDVREEVLGDLQHREIETLAENSDIRELVIDTLAPEDWQRLAGKENVRREVLDSLSSEDREKLAVNQEIVDLVIDRVSADDLRVIDIERLCAMSLIRDRVLSTITDSERAYHGIGESNVQIVKAVQNAIHAAQLSLSDAQRELGSL